MIAKTFGEPVWIKFCDSGRTTKRQRNCGRRLHYTKFYRTQGTLHICNLIYVKITQFFQSFNYRNSIREIEHEQDRRQFQIQFDPTDTSKKDSVI